MISIVANFSEWFGDKTTPTSTTPLIKGVVDVGVVVSATKPLKLAMETDEE